VIAATLARRDAATSHAAATAAAAQRKALRAECARREAMAEWENLLEMASRPGRPVEARHVARLGRAAGIPADAVALVARALGAVS
jgi:hypothetical protein